MSWSVAAQRRRCRWSILRGLGAAPPPAPVRPDGPLEELLADYGRYLSVERGLCDHTVFDAYVPAARLFLSAVPGGLERAGSGAAGRGAT